MQQVNLYLDELKKIEPKFSANIILIINGYVFFLGILVFIVLLAMSQYKFHQQKNLKIESEKWKKTLFDAEEVYKKPKIDGYLIENISRYEEKIEKNSDVLKYLKGKEISSVEISFSRLLEALARVEQDDTWLKRVEIFDSGRSMVLTGFSEKSEAIPEYLKKLSSMDEFKNTEFERVEISQKDNYLMFVIGSINEESKAGISLEKTSASY